MLTIYTYVTSYNVEISCFVQVLVVRNDLKMGKGKIAAQCRYLLLQWWNYKASVK